MLGCNKKNIKVLISIAVIIGLISCSKSGSEKSNSSPPASNTTVETQPEVSSPKEVSNLEIAELYLALFQCYKTDPDPNDPLVLGMVMLQQGAAAMVQAFKETNGQDATVKEVLSKHNDTIDSFTIGFLDNYWSSCKKIGGQLGDLPEQRETISKLVKQ